MTLPVFNPNASTPDQMRSNWQRLARALAAFGVNTIGQLQYIAENHATADAPASPVKGQLYFDTTLSKLRVWTGAAWETITSV